MSGRGIDTAEFDSMLWVSGSYMAELVVGMFARMSCAGVAPSHDDEKAKKRDKSEREQGFAGEGRQEGSAEKVEKAADNKSEMRHGLKGGGPPPGPGPKTIKGKRDNRVAEHDSFGLKKQDARDAGGAQESRRARAEGVSPGGRSVTGALSPGGGKSPQSPKFKGRHSKEEEEAIALWRGTPGLLRAISAFVSTADAGGAQEVATDGGFVGGASGRRGHAARPAALRTLANVASLPGQFA